MSVELIVLIVVITALLFDFTNGFHDAANAMATSVATGAFKPKVAVLLAAVMNLIGAFLSTEVAKTISSGIVDDSLISPQTVFAALVGAILWNLLTWLFGLPSSSSHAIFGALIGAVLVQAGMAGIHFSTVASKILLPALVAPVVAGVASFLSTKIAYQGAHNAPRGAKKRYRTAQKVSSLLVALSHGTSDGQKTMGIITLVLVAGTLQVQAAHPGTSPWWGQAPGSAPHWWVIVAAGIAIALGTYSGGWRIMRTMGKGMADIESPQGFAAETSAMACILASSHLGFGLSTTHVVSGAVMGTGLARTPDEVRWSTAGRMMTAWLLTLPASAIVGALAAWLAHLGSWGFVTVIVILIVCSVAIKIISSRNHVSHENVNDSHEVKVLAKAALSPQTSPIPNPFVPPLPEKLGDHPLATTPLRLTRLKRLKNKSPKADRKAAKEVAQEGKDRAPQEVGTQNGRTPQEVGAQSGRTPQEVGAQSGRTPLEMGAHDNGVHQGTGGTQNEAILNDTVEVPLDVLGEDLEVQLVMVLDEVAKDPLDVVLDGMAKDSLDLVLDGMVEDPLEAVLGEGIEDPLEAVLGEVLEDPLLVIGASSRKSVINA